MRFSACPAKPGHRMASRGTARRAITAPTAAQDFRYGAAGRDHAGHSVACLGIAGSGKPCLGQPNITPDGGRRFSSLVPVRRRPRSEWLAMAGQQHPREGEDFSAVHDHAGLAAVGRGKPWRYHAGNPAKTFSSGHAKLRPGDARRCLAMRVIASRGQVWRGLAGHSNTTPETGKTLPPRSEPWAVHGEPRPGVGMSPTPANAGSF